MVAKLMTDAIIYASLSSDDEDNDAVEILPSFEAVHKTS